MKKKWLLTIVMLLGAGLGFVLPEEEPVQPGALLPGNKMPALPLPLFGLGVDGEVNVRLLVSPAGDVERVEILRVTAERIEDWQDIEPTLSQWEFSPALQGGEPVQATYEVSIPFAADWPRDLARIYPLSPKTVYDEMVVLLEELGFRLVEQDDENQVLIARKRRNTVRKSHASLREKFKKSGFSPSSYALRCIVPAVAPARVYCNAGYTSRDGHSAHRGDVEGWVLDELDQRLGVEGRTIPANRERRFRLAKELAAGMPGILLPDEPVAHIPGLGGVSEPDLIRSTQEIPIYPGKARAEETTGDLIYQAVVQEDGITRAAQLFLGPTENFLDLSTRQAISFWRYKPATLDGVPVEVFITVVVSYKLR